MQPVTVDDGATYCADPKCRTGNARRRISVPGIYNNYNTTGFRVQRLVLPSLARPGPAHQQHFTIRNQKLKSNYYIVGKVFFYCWFKIPGLFCRTIQTPWDVLCFTLFHSLILIKNVTFHILYTMPLQVVPLYNVYRYTSLWVIIYLFSIDYLSYFVCYYCHLFQRFYKIETFFFNFSSLVKIEGNDLSELDRMNGEGHYRNPENYSGSGRSPPNHHHHILSIC